MWKPVIWRDAVDSTNRELLRRLAEGRAAAGTVLAARRQTAGRGRYERSWHMSPGRDLAFSFAWPVGEAMRRQVASLPMAAALAVVDTLRALGAPARTKWPNDVYVRERKIAGILAEMSDCGGIVVVGIGLNVGLSREDASRVGGRATSLALERTAVPAVGDVLDRLLAALASRLASWTQGGFAALRTDWERHVMWMGERVVLREGEAVFEGVLDGFGTQGELILRQGDGAARRVFSGDLGLPAAAGRGREPLTLRAVGGR